MLGPNDIHNDTTKPMTNQQLIDFAIIYGQLKRRVSQIFIRDDHFAATYGDDTWFVDVRDGKVGRY